MKLKTLWTWFAPGALCLYFGGDSSSSSAQTQTTSTTNIDQRAVSENGFAFSNSGAGSNLEVNVTDSGAIASAFGFAGSIAKDAIESSSAASIKAVENVKDAYADAKAGENKILVGVGVAVVGVVAFAALRRG